MIKLIVYGIRYGKEENVNYNFDVRSFLQKNPYHIKELRELTGLDEPVIEEVKKNPDFEVCCGLLVEEIVKAEKIIGDHSAGIYCTGGRHRSVVVGNEIKSRLEAQGLEVKVILRDSQYWK